MSAVSPQLVPPLPVGVSLDILCPLSCQSATCSGGGDSWPTGPAGLSPCLSSPCQNGGQCTELSLTAGTYFCQCPINPLSRTPSYFGDNCETTEDDCTVDADPCQYQAPLSRCTDCARLLPSTTGFGQGLRNPDCTSGYMCECPQGFAGAACDQDVDECASAPCQNGGTCGESTAYTHVHVGVYQCLCTAGWYGETCEASQDECTVLPAVPGGLTPATTMTCSTLAEQCTDCAKVTSAKFGKPAAVNPDCPNGYTCEPCPCPPAGGGPCPAVCGGGH